jgi:hypothetical protein
MEVSGQLHSLNTLHKKKQLPILNWRGGWMSPKAGLDAVE